MNETGRAGRPLKINLPFEDALKAALETEPPPVKEKPKRHPEPSAAKRVRSEKK